MPKIYINNVVTYDDLDTINAISTEYINEEIKKLYKKITRIQKKTFWTRAYKERRKK